MFVSVFDMFKIGLGPSSSHTTGPMVAAKRFLHNAQSLQHLHKASHVTIHLYGSLAMTGHGHATDKAILLGLSGVDPANILPHDADAIIDSIRSNNRLLLLGEHDIAFNEAKDLIFEFGLFHDLHSNAMLFILRDDAGEIVYQEHFFSVGGGFVCSEAEMMHDVIANSNIEIPYPFDSAEELLHLGSTHNLSIAEMVMANEQAFLGHDEICQKIDHIWGVMEACIECGIANEGILPGGLQVKRRAKAMHDNLQSNTKKAIQKHGKTCPDIKELPLQTMDWVNLFALAVNEENAVGGRVVTAPTNGAAGVIPAVLSYYMRFVDNASIEGMREFLLTASGIGSLYQKNASISAAEVGCQGEIGVACSMAAGALAAVLGGTNEQIENAAEIGMEHNLGLTCDPIKGLVQIPCIERNTMGAIKAINAARLALHNDGTHYISLDNVIKTMFETGKDMLTKYKETSDGGLAKISIALPEC